MWLVTYYHGKIAVYMHLPHSCTANCNYYSTAIRIKDIQAKNPGFTYKDYLEMNQGADEVTSSDPQTLTLVKTINQLISTEPCLREVSS